MEAEYHIPVLLNETIEGLHIDPEGIYIDVTFGGGGHSKAIINKLSSGKLVAFDQDSDAANNIINDERLIFVQHNFKYLRNFLDYYKIEKVDGILADLGVSSHDFDEPERGFSFRFDSPLDMRMNRTGKLTAAKVVNEYTEQQLSAIFKEYGELKNGRKIASVIAAARQQQAIETTFQLRKTVEHLVPAKAESKFLAKLFQALRIEVNNELEALKNLLTDAYTVLKPGGRLVVISYHSLEDRLVKNIIQKGNIEGVAEKDFYGNVALKFRQIGKVIMPETNEIEKNPRSRSAKLRIAEKV